MTEHRVLKVVDLTGKEPESDAVFDLATLHDEGVTTLQFCRYLVKELQDPAGNIGGFIKDGHGIALIVEGDNVTIVGVAPVIEVATP